jgi:hypothetical protein
VSYFTSDVFKTQVDSAYINEFYIVIGMGSFDVRYIREVDTFNGWQSVGAIGGFVFFLVLLHSVFMFLVGFCLENNSKFLGHSGAENAGSYSSF